MYTIMIEAVTSLNRTFSIKMYKNITRSRPFCVKYISAVNDLRSQSRNFHEMSLQRPEKSHLW